MSENESIKGIVEALIFTSDKPLLIEQIKEVIETIDVKEIRALIEELQSDYAQRKSGVSIIEVAGGYRMCSSKEYAQYLKRFYKVRHKEKLSMPALETLAIVAYKQPVTRLDIESIRGVNVDVVVKNLQEKGLIRTVGKKDTVGRPFVYGTTRHFLEYFGLRSLDELPKIEEFIKLSAEQQSDTEVKSEPEQVAQEDRQD
ncbi:SMC-Scp complex subunit ScpB [Candidatus Omnitrophota bacterium]